MSDARRESFSSDLKYQNEEGPRSPETLMPEEKKPKLIDRSRRSDDAPLQRPGAETPLPLHKPTRTQEELAPIAHKISENPDLMRRFREVIGSEDRERVSAIFDEIRRVAQSIDPTITHPEGTRMALVLMKRIGHGEGSND